MTVSIRLCVHNSLTTTSSEKTCQLKKHTGDVLIHLQHVFFVSGSYLQEHNSVFLVSNGLIFSKFLNKIRMAERNGPRVLVVASEPGTNDITTVMKYNKTNTK